MSIDVFGRQLGRTEGGTRGPPGFGFKLTTDGQYDVEGKRLCNVADASEPRDGVNLSLARRLVQSTLSELFHITTRLREDFDDLQLNIQILQNQVNDRLRIIEVNVETTLELATRNSEAIKTLDTRHGASEIGGRAA